MLRIIKINQSRDLQEIIGRGRADADIAAESRGRNRTVAQHYRISPQPDGIVTDDDRVIITIIIPLRSGADVDAVFRIGQISGSVSLKSSGVKSQGKIIGTGSV